MTDVAVFYSPGLGKWVIRKFDGFLTLGDELHDTEPTNDEIRTRFGKVIIRRGYSVMSHKMQNVMKMAGMQ